jgi:hypothetical protein
MPDVCGAYINAADFSDGLIHEVVFDVNIPVNNLLAFQLFDKWLKEWGELALQLYFAHTKQSLVVAYCSPYEVLEQKQFLQTDVVINPTLAGDVMKYKHAYTQIDDPFIGITNVVSTGTKNGDVITVGTSTFTVGQVIIKQHGGVATEFTSTIRGFDIHESVRDSINAKIIQRPLVIPSQEFPDPMPFPLPPNDGGISTNLNMSYQNCSCTICVFPKTYNQTTVMENPMLRELQLKVGSDYIPKKKFSTVSPRFYQEQLIVADLDGSNQATDEYTSSIVAEKNAADGTRYLNSLKDDTSFLCLFQTERGDGGLVYDGLTGDNLNTEITASAIHGGIRNTYFYPWVQADGTVDINVHAPAPQFWQCADTFFVVSGGDGSRKFKISYINTRSPAGSQIGDHF